MVLADYGGGYRGGKKPIKYEQVNGNRSATGADRGSRIVSCHHPDGSARRGGSSLDTASQGTRVVRKRSVGGVFPSTLDICHRFLATCASQPVEMVRGIR